jgi:hypothetical protein
LLLAVVLLGSVSVATPPWAVADTSTSGGAPGPHFGLYGVEPASFAEIAAVGFDVVHTYRFESSSPDSVGSYTATVLDYLDAAQAHGLRALVGLPRLWILQREERKIRAAIAAVRHHPALVAWYEEELGQQGHVGAVGFLSDVVESSDPEHGLILEENRRRSELIAIGRTRMFTYYPVSPAARRRGRLPSLLERFPTQQLRIPFWPVLQAYGQDLIAGCPKKDLVLPTRRELQYSLYSSVVHGASGIFFYTHRHPTRFDSERARDGSWPYVDYDLLSRVAPQAWDDVLATLAEARFLLSWTVGSVAPGVPVVVEEARWLEWTQRSRGGEDLLLLANGQYRPRTVRVTVPAVYKSWAVLHASGLGTPRAFRDGAVKIEVPGPGGVAVVFTGQPPHLGDR